MIRTVNFIKRSFPVILAIVLMMSALMLGVYADDIATAEVIDTEGWVLSDNEMALTYKDKTYYYYDYFGHAEDYLMPMAVYCFSDPVYYVGEEEGRWVYVYSYAENGEIVWLKNSFGKSLAVYATDKGKDILDDLFYTDVWSKCRLWGNNRVNAEIAKVHVHTWEIKYKSFAETKMDVRLLENVERYEIIAFDESDSFAIVVGYVFVISDEEIYYVGNRLLDNSYFTSDRKLSFRSGTLPLLAIEANTINDAKNFLQDYEPEYTYEEGYFEEDENIENSELDDTLGIITFTFFFSIGCFLLPIGFIILGLILGSLEKLGRPRYWYLVSICAAIWIIAAIAMFILIAIL